MKYIYLLLLVVAVSAGNPYRANAQVGLSLTTTSVSNSSPALGTQISILTSLTNTSTTDTFNGIINFALANKDSIITNLAIVGYPNYAGTAIILAPQQSRAALFTVQIAPSYFAVGPDIIIVWPIATNARILDSAAAPITITRALDINQTAADDISVFVTGDNLMVHNSATKTGPEQLRIFDLLGNLVLTVPLTDSTTMVPINNLSTGMYIAAVFNQNQQYKAVKFVR